jgi:tRNA threonylcarbamoyladenosine biosynthesis protein TsaE
MKKIFTEHQIPEIARLVLKQLQPSTSHLKPRDKALVVALYGDLGAGKTTLTKEIARQLGIKENVNSPTFVLIKNYKLKRSRFYVPCFTTLVHIDAYRFDSEKRTRASRLGEK